MSPPGWPSEGLRPSLAAEGAPATAVAAVRPMGTACAVAACTATVLLMLLLLLAHQTHTTQCFSRREPTVPNHGLTAATLRRAAPPTAEAAAALLELHVARSEPLVLTEGSAMIGWPAAADDDVDDTPAASPRRHSGCKSTLWQPECLRRRFGTQVRSSPPTIAATGCISAGKCAVVQ